MQTPEDTTKEVKPKPISEAERVLRVVGLLVLGGIFQAGALSLGLMRDHGPGTWSYGGLMLFEASLWADAVLLRGKMRWTIKLVCFSASLAPITLGLWWMTLFEFQVLKSSVEAIALFNFSVACLYAALQLKRAKVEPGP